MDYVVETAAQLDPIRRHRLGPGIRRIRLAGALADQGREMRLNRAYFACGCEAGSIAVMAVLVCSLTGGLILGYDGPFAWWRIGIYLIAAALVGKVAGLALARVVLERIVASLSRTDAALARPRT